MTLVRCPHCQPRMPKQKAPPRKLHKKTRMTPELRKYLTDWLHWAENGAPKHWRFRKGKSLCQTVPSSVFFELRMTLCKELGSSHAPFGKDFWNSGNCHLNPARLAWVRMMIEKG